MADIPLSRLHGLYDDLILPFYKLRRDMYIPTEDFRADNDAEHSWSLALMAILLAPKIDATLDPGKAAMYAAIHDLVEIYAGDTSVFAKADYKESKQKREKEALEIIREKNADFPHLGGLLDSYEQKSDDEARFVYAMDKFHNWMLAYTGGDYYYKKMNKIPKETAFKTMEESLAKAGTYPAVADYLSKLITEFKQRPENFYQEVKA